MVHMNHSSRGEGKLVDWNCGGPPQTVLVFTPCVSPCLESELPGGLHGTAALSSSPEAYEVLKDSTFALLE